MITFIVEKQFVANHAVRFDGGPEPVHGHNWNLRVEFVSRGEDVDPDQAGRAVADILAPLDHVNLHELPELSRSGATAEELAHYLHTEIDRHFHSADLVVHKVAVEEEPGNWASFSAPVESR